ncbi:MAG: thymidine phosphorylase [Polyangiaceae bacterium]|nr:thymidine phosphorylase [Polyangiaceae bacterium]MCW5792600.1 thymidine phosphorylase [Polyangiaceae bacterium]
MNPVEWILKKRSGGEHTAQEIEAFIQGFVKGQVADYQMSAWLMASFLNGLSQAETVSLTQAMLHSGDVLALPSVKAPKVDKHSTGGVGDKISICLAPLVAACGVAVPMISGRGLGHTGGTLDKLEAIRGYRVELDTKRFEAIVRDVGTSMIGQTARLAPADRRIYALRDVTGTVESIPLIVASILSKKLAEGIDGLVLDVKVGSGAFMKDLGSARQLARALVRVGRAAGKRVVALLTPMDTPIGLTIGNALETREALDVLWDRGPEDTRELTLALGVEMLLVAGVAKRPAEARRQLTAALTDGSAREVMRRMIRAHSGDPRVVDEPDRLPRAPHRVAVSAQTSGYVTQADALELGLCSLELGAGRKRQEDRVDHGVGIELARRPGDAVTAGEPLCWLHVNQKRQAEAVSARVLAAFRVGRRRVAPPPLVLERLAR